MSVLNWSDIVLLRADGTEVAFSAYNGKPCIVFYEDRGSTEKNQAFKAQLFALEKDFSARTHVIAIANLAAWNFFPARDFALAAIRKLEKKLCIAILVDFQGALTAAPFRLPNEGSTVVVLAPDGVEVMRKSGTLSVAEATEVLQRVHHAVVV